MLLNQPGPAAVWRKSVYAMSKQIASAAMPPPDASWGGRGVAAPTSGSLSAEKGQRGALEIVFGLFVGGEKPVNGCVPGISTRQAAARSAHAIPKPGIVEQPLQRDGIVASVVARYRKTGDTVDHQLTKTSYSGRHDLHTAGLRL